MRALTEDPVTQVSGESRPYPDDSSHESPMPVIPNPEGVNTLPMENSTGLLLGGSNSTSSSTTTESGSTDLNTVGMNILGAVIGILMLYWVTRPRQIPDARFQTARILREERERERRAKEEYRKSPEYRQELINNSLWAQKVIKEEGGELVMGPADAEVEGQAEEESVDSLGDETSTCVICLEPFRVGDVLAWSKGQAHTCSRGSASSTSQSGDSGPSSAASATPSCQECNHVFHKDCIASWLTNPKHDDCPACRFKIIQKPPVIDEKASLTGEELTIKNSESEDSSSDGGLGGGINFAFVVMNGLVCQVQKASYSLIGTNIDVGQEEGADSDGDDASVGMEMVQANASSEDPPANNDEELESMEEGSESRISDDQNNDDNQPLQDRAEKASEIQETSESESVSPPSFPLTTSDEESIPFGIRGDRAASPPPDAVESSALSMITPESSPEAPITRKIFRRSMRASGRYALVQSCGSESDQV